MNVDRLGWLKCFEREMTLSEHCIFAYCTVEAFNQLLLCLYLADCSSTEAFELCLRLFREPHIKDPLQPRVLNKP